MRLKPLPESHDTPVFSGVFISAQHSAVWFCYLEHLLVGGVLATLAAEVFAHALQLPAEVDHPLDGRLAPAAQLPLGLGRLHLCAATANHRTDGETGQMSEQGMNFYTVRI